MLVEGRSTLVHMHEGAERAHRGAGFSQRKGGSALAQRGGVRSRVGRAPVCRWQAVRADGEECNYIQQWKIPLIRYRLVYKCRKLRSKFSL